MLLKEKKAKRFSIDQKKLQNKTGNQRLLRTQKGAG